MITHTPSFETLATAPVKRSDVIVARQLLEASGYVDDAAMKWSSSTILMSVAIDSVGEMLGVTTKKATVKLLGIVSGISANELFQIRLGLHDGTAFEYISQGFFLIDAIDYDYEAGSTTVTLYDHMWTANKMLYAESVTTGDIIYPITVESFTKHIANLLNVTLAPFVGSPNVGHKITRDLYEGISGVTIQNVIQDIAGATGTTARITDTSLVFSPYKTSNENLNSDSLKTLKIGDTYGPITSVVLGRQPQNDNIALYAVTPFDNVVSSVDVTTNLLTITSHNMSDGNMIRFSSDGTLPAPLQPDTMYYVYTEGNANSFALAPTYEDAASTKHALFFDGINDYVHVPHSDAINVGNNDSYSVAIWFRTTGPIKDQSLSEKWHDSGPAVKLGYPWAIRGPLTSGKVHFNIYDGTTGSGTSTLGSVTDGKWHQLLGVRDHASDKLRLYLDGVLQEEVTDTTTGDVSTDRDIIIGARDPGGQSYNGLIRRFTLIRKALTGDEAKRLYDGQNPEAIGTVAADYRFDEGAGTKLTDYAGTANGTISGALWVGNYPRTLTANGKFDSVPTSNVAQTAAGHMNGTAAGGTTNVYNWHSTGNTGAITVMFDNSDKVTGTHSLKMSVAANAAVLEVRSDGATGYETPSTQGFALMPNTEYELSYWLKTAGMTGDSNDGVRAVVLEAGADGIASHTVISPYVKTNQAWTKYTVRFTTGAATVRGHIELRWYGHTGLGTLQGTAWFDDVVLRPVELDVSRNLIDITSAGSGTLTISPLTTKEIQINNNQILDGSRQELLPALYNKLSGIHWSDVKSDTVGLGWHEVGDVIQFTQGTKTVRAFLNEVHITLTGAIKENLVSKIPDVASINYQTAGGILKTLRNAEIRVDKQSNQITSIVSEQQVVNDQVQEDFTRIDQRIDTVNINIQNAGGGNLALNSVGYATDRTDDAGGTPYDRLVAWNYSGFNGAENGAYLRSFHGTVSSSDSTISQNYGGVSGRAIRISSDYTTGKGVRLTQRVNVAVDTPLSFGVRVKNSSASGTAKIIISNSNESRSITINNTTNYVWEQLLIEDFTSTMPWVDITIEASASDFQFTDLRLMYGVTIQKWSQADSEIMSTNVQFTQDGMRVFDEIHDTETRVTYNEFSTVRRSDGVVLFEADDTGVRANDFTIRGSSDYYTEGKSVIKQITIPVDHAKGGIAFLKGTE